MKSPRLHLVVLCGILLTTLVGRAQPDTALMGKIYREAKSAADQYDNTKARTLLKDLASMLTVDDSITNSYRINVHQLAGWMLYMEGLYAESENEYRQSLEIAKAKFPLISTQVANGYLSVAWICHQIYNMEGWKAYLDSAAALFPETYPPDHCQHGRIWDHRARINYFTFGPPDTTLLYADKARHIYQTCKGGIPLELFDLYKTYYDVYISLRQFDSAEHYLQLRIDFVNTQSGPKWEQQRAWIEYSKAHLYRLNGQYEKAIAHYYFAKSLFEKVEFDTFPRLGCELYAAVCLSGLGQHEEALKKFYEIQNFRFVYSKFTRDMMGLIHEGTARAFASSGQLDSAIVNAEKALFYFHQMVEPDNPKLFSLNMVYGECLSKANQHHLADSVLEVASAAAAKAFGDDHPMTIRLNIEHSRAALRNGDVVKSKDIIEKIASLEKLKQDPELSYNLLTTKAEIILTPNVTGEFSSRSHQELIIVLNEAMQKFREMRNQYLTEEARTRSVVTSIAPLHDLMPLLYAAFAKEKDDALFELMLRISETHRGLILSEAVVQSEAYTLAGVPKELQKKERTIKGELYQIRKKIDQEYTRMSPKKEFINELYDQQVKKQVELDALILVFQNEYPVYYRARFAHPEIALDEIQNHLAPEEVLLEYLVVGDELFEFLVTKESHELFRISNARQLMQTVKSVVDGMYAFTSRSGNSKIKDETLTALTRSLIPESIFQHHASASLIFIPDRVLHYLPFELLGNSAGRVINRPATQYLIYQHPVQYQSSLVLWMDQSGNRSRPLSRMLTVSPSFPRGNEELVARSGFSPLDYAENESSRIHELWKGKWLSKEKATKYNFLDFAERSDIIHLATHAKADDRTGTYSWLAFSPTTKDSLLYIDEIYGLDLKARMVVLSGCETGIGPLQTGEGLISLSRAFTYSGAESMITSLWPVHDEATAIIMTAFYKHLKEGKSKDKALQLAKIEYLEQITEPAQADPYYWAGFIAIGDMSPLTMSKPNYNLWILLGLLFVAGIIFWVKWKR